MMLPAEAVSELLHVVELGACVADSEKVFDWESEAEAESTTVSDTVQERVKDEALDTDVELVCDSDRVADHELVGERGDFD